MTIQFIDNIIGTHHRLTPRAVLETVRDTVKERPGTWTTGATHRDAQGNHLLPPDWGNTASSCALGWMDVMTQFSEPDAMAAAVEALARVARQSGTRGHPYAEDELVNHNDGLSTPEEFVEWVEKALATLPPPEDDPVHARPRRVFVGWCEHTQTPVEPWPGPNTPCAVEGCSRKESHVLECRFPWICDDCGGVFDDVEQLKAAPCAAALQEG